MAQRAEFLDLFGINKELLLTPDARGIALVESSEHVFARVFTKPDGTIVLQAADDIYPNPSDYRVFIKH